MSHCDTATLLTKNKRWIKEKLAQNTAYTAQLCKGQSPAYLYIGCSDSRVDVCSFTQSDLGEIFIQRNIANQAPLTDSAIQATLDYAIHALKVQHVIVCGHEACGGVQAAITKQAPESVLTWVKPISDLYNNQNSIDQSLPLAEQVNALVKLNVQAQIQHIKESPAYNSAEQKPQLHAWYFEFKTGAVQELQA